MQYTNGLRQPGDIGGPMDIGNGYRWNVPIVTYGFDQSFMDFFGTNGVAAVESAIQILNELPHASQVVLTNYPLDSKRINYNAVIQSLFDLKSEALALLIEHLGLAQPARYRSTLKHWSPTFLEDLVEYENGIYIADDALYSGWAYPDYIACLNFDPITLLPSFSVDGTLYGNYMEIFNGEQMLVPYPVDPGNYSYAPAVADNNSYLAPSVLSYGQFFPGLTEDDVGGLCYLYSTNNIVFENLLSDVRRPRGHSKKLIDGAWRPGIDKLTFVPHPTGGRHDRFLPFVYSYDDKFIANGKLMTQRVERVVSEPDFIFSAKNLRNPNGSFFFERTGTANWINNSIPNGSSGGGPGVIAPQVKIEFNKVGHIVEFYNDQFVIDAQYSWSSFNGTTNAPIVYPAPQEGTESFVVNMWVLTSTNLSLFPPPENAYQWRVTDPIGSISLFQTSSNMVDWMTMFSATNDGTSWYLFNQYPLASQRFYRVVPQQVQTN